MDIPKVWEMHLSAPFPSCARGREVSGVDLVLLDSSAAGCISTFIASGRIDDEQAHVLRRSLLLLGDAMNGLPSESRPYFERLAGIGRAVLEAATPGGGSG